ncbi:MULTISPECIES: 16S rRNA (uracil(1498)-N(3))-methyltransferase [unclassified Enterococcus]|uniref:16S rRNA (uracil(1498)-N(3))-methyltransferase n=1 Tax=unclassified Enterococcus TaxID=2608891 RepID=UPI001553B573|nr:MULTISPECIES: 16S rRNA (uracil(1498)-N(3))-methyltransferase [unclassified Enterococcus]MBS7578198.1 16S rRNA (uracil(1498)-N(3))-methyltransferase [Enterococcus sp. MMGLQ5-2]MBS7585426.1 16S rRNA (uracil(1498)-N(3))-methyltransferase [Enterococcus sp. MMGLQ5-1]NPD13283.1 16S rRNA (uracil(1498)-N(3))-methyltransferase [Enterococcus sp. MMGLQ5-1]NPD38029.1 16S rRNA (uracil(1498)-N(3))-methyltransferase [Enterococcus sp. MMGLQ5-2]
MQRYFINQAQVSDAQFIFPDEMQAHHMLKVLRMKPDSCAEFVLNEQELLIAKLVSEQPLAFQIIESYERKVELPVQISVATSFLKGEKLEWLAQKATELGASELIISPMKRAVVKWDEKKRAKRLMRLQKIAQEASEQSHRMIVPKITILNHLNDLLLEAAEYDLVLIAYEESAKDGEQSQFAQSLVAFKGQRILVIFGPEGGLDSQEIEKLESVGKLVGLGPRIMRAETAPLYVLSVLSFYFELYKGGGQLERDFD